MSDSPFIIQATASNFADLVALSHQKPVVVDFWAPWCAPCRTVKPLLEKLAVEYAGGFILALVNSDEEQALAQQYGVRSLPTILLMKNGTAVQTVMGAQPEPALRAMIDPHLAPRPSDNLRVQAKESLAQGKVTDAIELLKQAAEAEPNNYKIHLDLVSIFIQQGDYAQAKDLFNALGQEAKDSKEGKPLGQLLTFVSIIADAPSPDQLAHQLAENTKDSLSLYQLAAFAVLDRQFESAIQMYLQLFQQDPTFGEGAAKSCLLTIFEMLNPTQPELVKQGRRRLQTLMF